MNWIEVEKGQSLEVKELGLNLYVLKAKRGWVGTGRFAYKKFNSFNTKPFDNMEDAKQSLVNILVTGLCKCQFKLMATVSK